MLKPRSKAVLSPFAREVADVISQYSTLAEAILSTQSKLAGCSVAGLGPEDLEALIPRLREAVARFTSPVKAQRLESELRRLQRDKAPRPAPRSGASGGSASGGAASPRKEAVSAAPGSLSYMVLMVLGGYTPFGKQIFVTQCQSIDADPADITPQDLERLIPKLGGRVGQWTSPIKGRAVEEELRRILTAAERGTNFSL